MPNRPPPPLQVLFLAGVAMTIGAQATLKFFIRPKNYKGSGFFLGGVSLVVWGWTLVGFALEAYGFWLLFSAFFPTALSFLRRMPFLRQLLDTPAFKGVSGRVAESVAVRQRTICTADAAPPFAAGSE